MENNYTKWVLEVKPKTGDIIILFDKYNNEYDLYGMIMSYEDGFVVIYKEGFDYLEDVYKDIQCVYRPKHPAFYSPYNWRNAKDKADCYYVASKRYVSKEKLEEELGYKIEFI